MSKHVVIVESPAKAKTINKYLGKDYFVIASMGHVRDLPSKDGSVKPDESFAMVWNTDPRGEKQIKEIAKALSDAQSLVLATDPDREGEAIAWHVLEELKRRKKLKNIDVRRVVFHQITKSAILEAMESPREIDVELVDAYLARRALDYLVGFTLSPVLWRKLPGSKSAGRVQSVALKLVCQRENEIENFKSDEYWSLEADLFTKTKAKLISRLTYLDGKKLDKFDIPNEAKAKEAERKVKSSQFYISRVFKKQTKRNPYAPFTTSTLQQEAARKLGFSAKKTMQVAQRLYEGINISGETTGLITYMRTDAVSMAPEAISEARKQIEKDFGKRYIPNSPRIYKTKSKNAQEAHEAIRPTSLMRKPSLVKNSLDKDQLRLYDLIWKRATASQMSSAELDQLTIDSSSKDKLIVFRSTGQTVIFDGFLRLYQEDRDDGKNENKEKILPQVKEGEDLSLEDVRTEQHFTQPPPRFSEASLVKKLEELGIGRPSTYASIISVLQERDYVKLNKKRFYPEDRGRIVTAFLENYFDEYIQYDFTANMENSLDEISKGELNWKELLTKFWGSFYKKTEEIKSLSNTEIIDKMDEVLGQHFFVEQEDGSDPRKCPKCDDGRLSIKVGRFGAFIGCSNYPDCGYTKQLSLSNIESLEDGQSKNDFEDKELGIDEQTQMPIYIKKGPYGVYVQLGDAKKGSKTKPKRCALPKGLKPEEVDFNKAKDLLSLPREVGVHPETGEKITAAIGRYGPYVKHKSTYKSLTPEDDVLTVGMNRALALLATAPKNEPKELGNHPDDGKPVRLMAGRFGPYVKHNKTNASLPKALKEKENITLEEALELLKEKEKKAPKKKASAKKKKTSKKKKAAKKKSPAKKKVSTKKKA